MTARPLPPKDWFVRLAAVLALAGGVGCSHLPFVKRAQGPVNIAAEGKAPLTVPELQFENLRFADNYSNSVAQATDRVSKEIGTRDAQVEALKWKLEQSTAAYVDATGQNPLWNTLDLVGLATVTVAIDGSFADVPRTSLFASMIERLYHSSITAGCGVSPLVYCPAASVTRAQMAVFLERGMRGATYVPPAATGMFGDVPASSPFAPWIEQLAHDGVTAGCGGGNFCPQSPVTRAQMAVFLTKARHPVACTYPATGTVFTDVPPGYWAGGFIEQLWHEGVTGGCGAGLFCPETAITRQQMAAFLVRGFRLP